jgi:glycine cleavage system H protein
MKIGFFTFVGLALDIFDWLLVGMIPGLGDIVDVIAVVVWTVILGPAGLLEALELIPGMDILPFNTALGMLADSRGTNQRLSTSAGHASAPGRTSLARFPSDRRYTQTHEWVKIEGDVAIIGLTSLAVQQLSEGEAANLIYCDLPEQGRILAAGVVFGELESVAFVSELYAPIAGEVLESNLAIEDHLEILFNDPWNAGWILKLRPDVYSLDGLMDAYEYEQFVTTLRH